MLGAEAVIIVIRTSRVWYGWADVQSAGLVVEKGVAGWQWSGCLREAAKLNGKGHGTSCGFGD